MPPPAVLYQYEQVVPGFADRIAAMAEQTTTGSIKTKDKLADAEIEQAGQAQSFAFVITLIALVASIVFFALGDVAAGSALIGMPVVMLIKSFLKR